VGGPEANTIYEDCGEAQLIFTRPPLSSLDVQDMVVVTWNGTADMGVDYSSMPDTIFFPIGVSQVVLEIDAFEDGIAEGLENVYLDILNIAACNGSGLVTNFEFFIADEPEPLVVDGYSVEICQGDTITLEPIITGGYGNFHYDWSTGETTQTIDAGPLATTDYFLTVSDTCGMPSDDGVFTVEILVFPPLDVEIDNGNLLIPCNGSENVTATASGGDGMYTYYWYDEDGNNLWGWMNTLWYGSWSGEGEINVDVTDGCGFTVSDMVTVEIDAPDLIVDAPTTINAPCNQPFTATMEVSGGTPTYWYQWAFDGVMDWNQWTEVYSGSTNEPGLLQGTVFDGCGQSVTVSIDITVDSPPIELTLVDSVQGNCQTPFLFEPTVAAGSGGFEFQWSENGNSLGTNQTLNFSSFDNTIVSLLVTDQCGAEATDDVIVTIVNPELTVTLGDDINASCVDNTLITPLVDGGSGVLQYQWFIGNSEQTEITPTFSVQTFNTVNVGVVVSDFCGEEAMDEVAILIPDIPLTIDAGPDTTICPLQEVTMYALADGGEGGFTYEWQEIEQSGSLVDVNPITSSLYTVVASDICGETVSTDVAIEVRPASADFLVTNDGENLYTFTATPGSSCGIEPCIYVWEMGDGSLRTDSVVQYEFDGLGSYTTTLHITNDIGCTDYASYTVVGPPLIYIPSSFTPNNDGVNDVFAVVSNSLLEYEIKIFNRWGEIVFESNNPEDVWVGDTSHNSEYFAKDGIYSYVVRIKGFDSDSYQKKGFITLIR
ncbi:MAG: gliding motility-associated C-terminal domain-containing protein, partial [Flavobacteriales bacterium]